MSKLATPLAVEQRKLIELLGNTFGEWARWPNWQWLQHQFDAERLDAREILLSLPEVGDGQPHGRRYGLVRYDHHALRDGDQVGLTVAGMALVPAVHTYATGFLNVLKLLIDHRRRAVIDPFQVTDVRITKEEIQAGLPTLSPPLLTALPDLLNWEPATVGSRSNEAGNWWRELSRELLHYDGIDSLPAYVARTEELITPAPVPSALLAPASPFSLPAAWDYCNAVWQLHFSKGQPMLQLFSAERTARLSAPVNDAYEFEGQVNALAELIRSLQISGVGKKPLDRLEARLLAELSAESAPRVRAAVETLRNVAQLRNSTMHDGSEHRGITALQELSIGYPVTDWAEAWLTIQQETIRAVDALRVEMQQHPGAGES